MKKNKQIAKQNAFTDFLLYTTPNGKVKVEIFLRNDNLWLTQKRMADLFGVGIPAINKHLKNIFETGELQEESVISVLEITAVDGKILHDSGKISHEIALALAESEYEKYQVIQDRMLESDFDHEVKKLLESEKKKL